MPQDLTKLTAEQVEWCVAYHAAMPLSKIRRWQELVDEQIGMAWQQRNDFALNNLRVMEELLRRGAESKLPPLGSANLALCPLIATSNQHQIFALGTSAMGGIRWPLTSRLPT